VIEHEKLCFRAVDTPAHAFHHYAYLFRDVASARYLRVRMSGVAHVRLPMVPPEFQPGELAAKLEKIKKAVGSLTLLPPTSPFLRPAMAPGGGRNGPG